MKLKLTQGRENYSNNKDGKKYGGNEILSLHKILLNWDEMTAMYMLEIVLF